MKKVKQQKPINSDAYAYLKKLIHPDVKIYDAFVDGKWLKALLSSGITFSVKNTSK